MKGELSFNISDDILSINISGEWKIGVVPKEADAILNLIQSEAKVYRITFDTHQLKSWDSGLLTFLLKVIDISSKENITVDKEGLPHGVKKMLSLATALPERKGPQEKVKRITFLETVGSTSVNVWRSVIDMVNFLGEATIAFNRMLVGKASFRRSDLFVIMQESGVQALPIVSLISVLVGLILAFVGAIQLKLFGAQIYVANIVGIAMVRVMGAIMTGIIMAGRTGAAFAAQLGTMQTNEEIDALKTLGISPMEFLVLPRMLALTLMMPLLCLYADLMGILGGMIVGVGMLNLNPIEYYNQTKAAVSLNNLWIGLFHSAVFGILVALSSCLRGIQCGRSAQAVGYAATSAVVTSIVSIIVATAIITFACEILGI